jgi:hypothetical protein
MHVVPIFLEAGVNVATTSAMFWHGTPITMAVSGSSPSGEPILVMGTELPIEYVRPRYKNEVERLHVERLRIDLRARGAGDPFISVRPSMDDPPDVLVRVSGSVAELGLECTRFADQERLEVSEQFTSLAHLVERVPPSHLRHLKGFALYVSYHDEIGQSRPLRADDARQTELVETLIAVKPRRMAVANSPKATPSQLSDPGRVRTPSGFAEIAPTELSTDYRPSSFMTRMGFELCLGYTTTHTAESIRRQLESIVSRKDDSRNQILLITAGGPDRAGMIHSGEEMIVDFIRNEFDSLNLTPTHLKQVLLHRWGAGDVFELFPTARRVAAPASITTHTPGGVDRFTLAYPTITLSQNLLGKRNAPCACGSGLKAKVCHLAGV